MLEGLGGTRVFVHAGVVLGIAASVNACAVTKVPMPVGGSRADGTVYMAYEYGKYERPQVDVESAQSSAARRCAAWGYSAAEAFGGSMTNCTSSDQYGCNRWRVTMTYQCTTGTGS